MAKRQRQDELLSAAIWWKEIVDRSNEAFLPCYRDRHRYLVMRGGAGSGKSVVAADKVDERCYMEPGHRFLVCRKVGRTLRDSCFAQLRGVIAQKHKGEAIRINKTDMTILYPNGSVILFAGLDDVEKLKSIYEITDIWIEEASEIFEQDFNQLDIRCRGKSDYYQQIILTFNPVSVTHWLKKRFFDKKDPDAFVHNSTYKDNRFLPEKNRQVLEKFKDTDPYYYMVYCLNQWGVTGNTVFSREAISERLQQVREPIARGYFAYELDADELHIRSYRWVEDDDGQIRIYHFPQDGTPYVCGGDTAGTGSDEFTAQMIDNCDGTQMAVLEQRMDEDEYTRQIYCLGKLYNEALLAIECNYSSYPNKMLDSMGYRNLYVREREDSFLGTIRDSYGIRTDKLTRPVMIANLKSIMRDHISLINDRQTLEQMLAFVRTKNFREEAEEGAHDDLVMALAIAFYARPQQRMQRTEKDSRKSRKWTKDQWEDYRAANAEERAYLITKWGKPE